MSDSNFTFRFCKTCKADTERGKDGKCKICVKARSKAHYEANKEKHAISREAWKVANLEKVKAYSAEYYQLHKEKYAISRDKWRAANRDKENATNAAYKLANPEKQKAIGAAWRKANPERFRQNKAAWRAANPDRVKEAAAAWFAANPEARRIYSQNRRALKSINGGVLSKDISGKLMKLQKGKCACCGKPLGNDYHLDHILPVSLGGPNSDENMQLLRKLCNLQKNAKHPVDFMQQRGFLL